MKIIDPNSPLIQALGKLSDVIICNMLFCIFSLPLFTLGAALSAMHSCMMLLIEDKEDDLIVKDFWRAFKANFKQATAIWLLCLPVIVLLLAFYFVVNALIDILGRAYLIPYFFLLVLFICGFLYLFPIQARYKLRLRDIIKNAWLLSIGALPWTLLCLLVIAGAVFLTFRMMSFDMCLFIWAVMGFALVCYLNTFWYRQAFKKMDPNIPLQSSAAPEEALFIDEAHMGPETHMHSISTFSNPDWNRQEYPLSDRKDVQGKGSRKGWKPKK